MVLYRRGRIPHRVPLNGHSQMTLDIFPWHFLPLGLAYFVGMLYRKRHRTLQNEQCSNVTPLDAFTECSLSSFGFLWSCVENSKGDEIVDWNR